jgi:hypothetical protein
MRDSRETRGEIWQDHVRKLGDHVKIAGVSGERQLRGYVM